MQLSKPLILFALFFLTMLTTSQAQCELSIDYSFQESPNSLYAISLRSQAVQGRGCADPAGKRPVWSGATGLYEG
jgi:hypothetical protein